MIWVCILCSTRHFRRSDIHREAMLCSGCRSTWRARATGLAVQQGLGYEIQPYKSILSDWSRIGLGISDDINLSVVLSSKFFYSNSYYDTFPHLDIRNIPGQAKNSFEFVTCSDVLEHIDTGITKSIRGLRSLIKPGGFSVVSVPINDHEGHEEFYKSLIQFEIRRNKVYWKNSHGENFIDKNPEFHGGRGQNLAFRQFSVASFNKSLLSAGFSELIELNFSSKFGVPEIEFPGIMIARF